MKNISNKGGIRVHKKLRALLLTAIMVSTFTATTFATTQEQIKKQQQVIEQLRQQNAQNKGDLDKNAVLEQEAEKKVQDLETKIEQKDTEISTKQIKIDEANNQIAKTNEEITKSQFELDKAKLEMEKEQEIFGERASALYMNGTGSYIQLLLESDGFFDLISRIQTLKDISEHDNAIMKELQAKKDDVESKQKSLKTEKQRLVALKEQNEADLKEIVKDKEELQVLIAKATEERNYYASISKSFRDKQEANNRQIALAQQTIENWKNYGAANKPVNKPSRGEDIPASELGRAVVLEAYKYLNVPYVWGGTSPSGFDCSGLVQYVYAKYNVGLSRTTYTQVREGVAVSRDNLQPGDLVFFGSASSPHHVGIYVGNGSYIHAPRTGDVVKISSLSGRRDYATARRIA